MPFKSLSAPRKVNDLSAEITSGAVLHNPGLVAMATSDPVRVGVHSFGSTSGKAVNAELDRADAIAFLTRDVAVVQSGDVCWALLNLMHSAKIEEVARDVRCLAAKPNGDSALVVGWDGGASELKLDRNDVEARSFSVRGSIRAAELGENEAYVVVDGEGGGQFRVHPGATPEPGAVARASLPLAAAKLDRLRASAKLAVVYQRGADVACVVSGGPARFEAKMVRFEGPIGDLGVVETSLFVAYRDGRAALYDGDAIARATEAGIEAKATVQLGGKGEPKVVVATAKGSPALWIGTDAGEVFTVGAIRKGV